MSIHIERYLCGGTEFETDINRITVGICSFSPSFTTTTLALALAFDTSNLTCQHGNEPLPSNEGCGLLQHPFGSLTSEVAAQIQSAPPLSKGMWAG